MNTGVIMQAERFPFITDYQFIFKPLASSNLSDCHMQLRCNKGNAQKNFQNVPSCYIRLCCYESSVINTRRALLLPTQCIYVFCLDLRKNSDYFPIRH